MQRDVTFACDDGHSMRGVLTVPEGIRDERRPALLLLYEIFGLNEAMRRVARDFAAQGYVVLIPDLYDRGHRALCIASTLRAMKRGHGQAIDDLEAARRYLVACPEVDPERIGVIGFCMGGAFTLVLATQGRYRAAAPFYGPVPDVMPQACPIVASFGALDKPYRDDPEKLRRRLQQLGAPHDIKVYEGVGHSFYTPMDSAIMRKLGPLLPLHAAYDEPAALDARKRVLDFFDEHL
ncbi:dienelactone hydrolase family protein [Chondromyces crocatus]|uniref:Carboxymethylenebutenolidase n=1 Tax=Chondromyces crocatus TaxID=52 RepID=A0A0K1EQC2_CHOCO|nr:dienelactone hydrolase family protein [Chondromyces crocatus]AKT43046.1 carboxymethylenebutenolidase [Chondromyces crocatus]